jgi:xylulokinase
MTARRGLPATIGVDLSTTAAKAVVRRADGQVLALASSPYPTRFLPDGRAEQDAEDWWRSTVLVVRQAVKRAGGAKRITAFGISTQGISVVPVDRRGFSIRASLNWLDLRASAEANDLAAAFTTDRLFAITGRQPGAAFTLPKIAWLRRHEPDLFARAERWLTPLPFLVLRMTGRAVSDHTMAVGTLAYDIGTGTWSDELLDWAGVARSRFPELSWSGDVAGALESDAADELGLPAGLPVVLGAQDQKSAAFAAGLAPGVATLSLGTAAAIIGLADRVTVDAERRIPASPYLWPGTTIFEGVVPAAGASLDWLSRLVSTGAGRTVPVERLLALASRETGTEDDLRFVPHLNGSGTPVWQPEATGALTGLRLATSLGDVVRALLTGIAGEISSNLTILRQLQISVNVLHAFGGGARSALWLELIERACGVPIVAVHQPEMAAVGAAMLAEESTSR